MKKFDLVVTRHPALVSYLQEIGLASEETTVLPRAIPEEIRGKNVCGVLPHSLSCLCNTFTEVPLNVPQELRGTELSIEQIREFAGEPITYRITTDAELDTDVIEIVRETSTNGRWGLKVLGPKGCSLLAPQEGEMESLGTIERYETYQFTPKVGSGKWYMVGGDLVPLECATVVCNMSLQSNNEVTIILGSEFFAVKSYGYKRRSSSVSCYLRGNKLKASSAILASMGVIPCKRELVEETPPEPEGKLAEALKAAGIV